METLTYEERREIALEWIRNNPSQAITKALETINALEKNEESISKQFNEGEE